MSTIKLVTKRDGRVVPFTQERITNAIYRAAVAVGGRDKTTARRLSDQVVSYDGAEILPLIRYPPWRRSRILSKRC